MKWPLVLVLAAVSAAAFAVVVGRLTGARHRRLAELRRAAWLVATTLLLVMAVYGAHLLGLFSVPIVAIAFVVIAVPARSLLGLTRRRRLAIEEGRARAATDGSRRPHVRGGALRLLERHQLLLLAVLGSAAAAGAVVLAAAIDVR